MVLNLNFEYSGIMSENILISVRNQSVGQWPMIPGLTIFENFTLKSDLMADKMLDMNMNMEALGSVG